MLLVHVRQNVTREFQQFIVISLIYTFCTCAVNIYKHKYKPTIMCRKLVDNKIIHKFCFAIRFRIFRTFFVICLFIFFCPYIHYCRLLFVWNFVMVTCCVIRRYTFFILEIYFAALYNYFYLHLCILRIFIY